MIKAKIPPQNTDANLKDYENARRTFSWKEVEKGFSWSETGRLNMVHEAIDRWTQDPEKGDRIALIFEDFETIHSYSFNDLKRESSRMANLLADYGLTAGDRFFIFLPPSVQRYVALLACARLGVVCCPLYPNLNYYELEVRVENGRPHSILTHPLLAEILPVDEMDLVQHIFFSEGPLPGLFHHEVLLDEQLPKYDDSRPCAWLEKDAPLYLLYTSGSTGPPKGVLHAHGDMVGHLVTARYALDLDEKDVLWTDADPAWVLGTVYGIFAPWLIGACVVAQGSAFSASTWYRTLEQHRITVWYTTTSSLAGLTAAGDDLPGRYDLSALRHIATVGETLAPEIFFWVKKYLGMSVHENWWMTETGMICLANFPSQTVKPGSMGKPVPGVEAAVLDEKGHPLPILTMGELSLKIDWPTMMIGLWNDLPRYRQYFRFDGWFNTGDMVIRDEEGYYYHQGRNDDMIKVEDKLVGPFEVEHVLVRHPAVHEAAVISKTNISQKPLIKAFVTLHRGFPPSTRLKQEIKEFVKAGLSPQIPLREVAFLDKLPKTLSGKLLRRVLRAQELALPGGDVSRMTD